MPAMTLIKLMHVLNTSVCTHTDYLQSSNCLLLDVQSDNWVHQLSEVVDDLRKLLFQTQNMTCTQKTSQ